MIPPFDSRGLLPSTDGDAPYQTTVDEIHERLVATLGSPAWRVGLFTSWQTVSRAVAETVPSARWWVWGCFVSDHREPLFGESETLSTIVIVPEAEIRLLGDRLPMLVGFLQAAEEQYRVDVDLVYEFEPGDDRTIETMDVLDFRWRPRASKGVADHATRELESAGFLEVRP